MDVGVDTAQADAMIALGVGSFLAGMLPAFFSENRRQRHPFLLSCLLCFGGGVLLATSLTHMLPETREKNPDYSELIFCLGFFLVYLVDEIFHLFYRSKFGHGLTEVQTYGSIEETGLLRTTRLDDELKDRGALDSSMCHVSHTAPCSRGSFGVIGLLCALLVHSVLEGLAIGLQDEAPQIYLLLGAVVSHKYVVGFCLGAEVMTSFPRRIWLHILCIGLFSGGSVAGVGIGIGLQTVECIEDTIAVSVMQGLAAGTLLYVTVSEVLPRERARWHERKRLAGPVQLLSVALGFGLMYLATSFLDNDGA